MSPLFASALVVGWLVLAISVGVVIGAVVRRRDRQRSAQAPPLSRAPRGNVDETRCQRAVAPRDRG